MTEHRMRKLMFVATFLLGATAFAHAADDVDVAVAQSIIRSQEQAIARDDAAAAYSFATPAIQSMFGDPEAFMQMVRQGFAPVYRHKVLEFGSATISDGTIRQNVHIVDANGIGWDALYTLEQQPDGSLRISGCTLSNLLSA
jgi:hypothetical protein